MNEEGGRGKESPPDIYLLVMTSKVGAINVVKNETSFVAGENSLRYQVNFY